LLGFSLSSSSVLCCAFSVVLYYKHCEEWHEVLLELSA
jgi:hypothetical protein